MSTPEDDREPSLKMRIVEARGQLMAMRAKQRRLNEALRQREQHILRLEATAALSPSPSVSRNHER